MKYLSEPEAHDLYKYLLTSIHPQDILLQVLFETGARISESLTLGPHSLSHDLLAIEPLKGSLPRNVPLSPNLTSKLNHLSNKRLYIHAATETRRPDSQRRALHRRLKTVSLQVLGHPVNPHALRHTAFNRLYVATKDLILVQKWAGHRSINSTAAYMHEDLRTQANEVMSNILLG